MTEEEKRAIYTKKLLYQSMHRGCKETDIILGNFAQDFLTSLNDAELQEFEDILAIADNDFYDWYTNKKPLPSKHQGPLMAKILTYKPVE